MENSSTEFSLTVEPSEDSTQEQRTPFNWKKLILPALSLIAILFAFSSDNKKKTRRKYY